MLIKIEIKMNVMSLIIHQPHDKLFKLSMGEIGIARDFFKSHLPESLLNKLNLSTLRLRKNSFIDEAYKSTEADVLYSVLLEKSTAYLYILCEHQSKIDFNIAFRLLTYTFRIMEKHQQQFPNVSLPIVYPLVVYSGEKLWDAPLDIFSLFGEQESLARELLFKPYHLLDLSRMDDDIMRQQAGHGLVAFVLKYRQARDFANFLETLLPWIEELEKHNEYGTFLGKVVLKYVLNGIDSGQKDIFMQKIIGYLSDELRGEAMTIAQQLREEGFEKGMHQGLQQGLLHGRVLVIQFLRHRFGELPSCYAQMIMQADADALLQWGKKALDANNLIEVFETVKV